MKPTFPPRLPQWRPGQPLEQPPLPFWARQGIASTPSPQDVVLLQRLVDRGQTEMASLMAQVMLKGMNISERLENPLMAHYLMGVSNEEAMGQLYRDTMFKTYGLTEDEVRKMEMAIR